MVFLTLLLIKYIMCPKVNTQFVTPRAILRTFLRFSPRGFSRGMVMELHLPHLTTTLLANTSLKITNTLLRTIVHGPLKRPRVLNLGTKTTLTIITTDTLKLTFPIKHPLLTSANNTLLFLLVLLLSSTKHSKLAPVGIALYNITLSTFISSVATTVLVLSRRALLTVQA